ncbi:hypothetical protein A1OE_692 [Candidatus Endolissoclinum faulkneri L2]|uniref:Uncharacterized protein n=1 Tax=Candidatus Endolissoclinum faulkneri L2 TaxID=1193729 RepID=K7YH48_9PROT|nr:hypothetical protein A1OE_692 [Candidatus Endolissoclinum faulkneri L2]
MRCFCCRLACKNVIITAQQKLLSINDKILLRSAKHNGKQGNLRTLQARFSLLVY